MPGVRPRFFSSTVLREEDLGGRLAPGKKDNGVAFGTGRFLLWKAPSRYARYVNYVAMREMTDDHGLFCQIRSFHVHINGFFSPAMWRRTGGMDR